MLEREALIGEGRSINALPAAVGRAIHGTPYEEAEYQRTAAKHARGKKQGMCHSVEPLRQSSVPPTA